MAITAASVSVGTSATALNTQGGGSRLLIQNTGGQAVTVGGSTVAAGAGWTIPITTGTLDVRVMPGDVLYGIVASATSTVLVTRIG